MRAWWRVLSNFLGMTHAVLLNCPIKAEIRAVDSQSDLTILLQLWLSLKLQPYKSECSFRILLLCKEMLFLILQNDAIMEMSTFFQLNLPKCRFRTLLKHEYYFNLSGFYLHVFVYYFGSRMCLFVWNWWQHAWIS